MERINALIMAWRSWDERPGNENTAAAMTNACRDYPEGNTVDFRRHLSAMRRAGLSYRKAIESWSSR